MAASKRRFRAILTTVYSDCITHANSTRCPIVSKMTHRPAILAGLTVLLLLGAPRAASADITAFLGVTPTPDNRSVRGLAFGAGILFLGFEFEYANAGEDEDDLLPGLKTW